MLKTIIPIILLTACATGVATTASNDSTLWTLSDPRGDDYGTGTLAYPMNPDYERGDLDLLGITARRVAGGTELDAEMARPVRVPTRRTIDAVGLQLDQVAKLGFYTFNIDVYVDTDGSAGSGSTTTLPGRGVVIDPATAWEKVISLTPDPQAARSELKRIVVRDERRRQQAEGRKGIIDDAKKQELQDSVDDYVYFPDRVRVSGNRVTFFIPDSFLGGEAKREWSYVIAVTGADVINRYDQQNRLLRRGDPGEALMVLPVATGRPIDRFGGAVENDDFMPPIVDIIVAPGQDQKSVLSGYDANADRAAVLRGVVPAR